ncbi:MAG TPA: FkbM family methyltransferase, partial [Verrucomicrobiaceae bacterium]
MELATRLKRGAEHLLAHWPRLYARLLRARHLVNLEKLSFLGLVRPNDFVLEGGANVGIWTLLFGALVGKTGRVHAFEPVPQTYRLLARQMSSSRMRQRITTVEAALSDANGQIDIMLPGTDFAQASLRRQSEGSWRTADTLRTLTCRTWRGDDYLAAAAVEPPHFIKLDVEGAELPALRGLESTLNTKHPLLHLEVCAAWQRSFGYTPADLLAFLTGKGYDIFCSADRLGLRMFDPSCAAG